MSSISRTEHAASLPHTDTTQGACASNTTSPQITVPDKSSQKDTDVNERVDAVSKKVQEVRTGEESKKVTSPSAKREISKKGKEKVRSKQASSSSTASTEEKSKTHRDATKIERAKSKDTAPERSRVYTSSSHNTNSSRTQHRRIVFPKADHSISTMSNKERPYIEWLAKGIKKAEGRVNIPMFQRMRVGQTVCFHNRHNYVYCKITYLHTYTSFEEMITCEGLKNLLPFASTDVEGTKVYNSFPGASRVRQFGVVAIGVQPLERMLPEDKKPQECTTIRDS